MEAIFVSSKSAILLDGVPGHWIDCKRGPHWSSLHHLLPLYRSITTVRVGDGASASFWRDAWLPLGALHLAMPKLFTHCLNPEATVASVFSSGLDRQLAPHLSTTASRKRGVLVDNISGRAPSEGGG
jgi:hypothetical protein